MNFIKEGGFYLANNETKPFLMASSYESSLRDDKFINEKLKKLSYIGEVYIDMLLTKGASSSRFIECFFNGNNFETHSARIIDIDSNKHFKDIEKEFCSKYSALIENSILSYSEKQIAYGNE